MKTVNRLGYKNYIASDQWKDKRKKYYSSKLLKKCAVCGTTKNLNLHHKSYKTLGNENLKHLVPLCQNHHKLAHEYITIGKKLGLTRINTWNVIKKFKNRLKNNKPPPVEQWTDSMEQLKRRKGVISLSLETQSL